MFATGLDVVEQHGAFEVGRGGASRPLITHLRDRSRPRELTLEHRTDLLRAICDNQLILLQSTLHLERFLWLEHFEILPHLGLTEVL